MQVDEVVMENKCKLKAQVNRALLYEIILQTKNGSCHRIAGRIVIGLFMAHACTYS